MEVPKGVTVTIQGNLITMKGPKGESKRTFSRDVKVQVNGSAISVEGSSKMMVNTALAHLNNMAIGTSEGFSMKLKLIHAHFPMSLIAKGLDVEIKNFLGEKKSRHAKLLGATKLEVKGQDVTIHGPDREHVSQSYANLKTAMKIKDKDGRVFQDGLYPTN